MNRTICFALVLIGLSGTSCLHTPRTTRALFGERFIVFAHRGASQEYPQNTMIAFRSAARSGAAIELDILPCATGELIVFHDYEVSRLTDGKGAVKDLSLKQIKQLDAGYRFERRGRFPYRGKGIRIPTLEEVLKRFGGKVLLAIELKSEGMSDAERDGYAAKVVELLVAKKMTEKVFVTAFDPFLLEKIATLEPSIIRAQDFSTFAGIKIPEYQKFILRNRLLNFKSKPDVLFVEHVLATEESLESHHKNGYRVFPWTVNDPDRIRELIDLGADGVITDVPAIARKICRAAKRC